MAIKFSIICAAYNSDKWVSEAIESVINQSYTNWELIFVLDSLEDTTIPIIEKYIKKTNKIKYLIQDGRGPFLARKYGVEHSSGDYLMFIDADDCYKLNCLEVLYFYLSKKDYDFITFGFEIIKNQKVIRKYFKNYSCLELNDNESFLKELYIKPSIQMSLWNKCYKKETYDANFSFSQDVTFLKRGEDYLFSIFFASKIKKCLFLDEILYCYKFINDNSLIVSENSFNSLKEEIFIQYYESYYFLIDKVSKNDYYFFLSQRLYELISWLRNVSNSNYKHKEKLKYFQEFHKDIKFIKILYSSRKGLSLSSRFFSFYFRFNLFNIFIFCSKILNNF